jgi:acyl-CoA synthetase (AMP-forming)/AMP-acid ligase II
VSVVNVGLRLSETARLNPHGIAVAMPRGRDTSGKRIYESVTFRQLDDDSNLLADGFSSMGVRPGMRLVLMVPPSIDFISLVFAMFKAGVVTVLIDPGMGRRNLVRCLADSEPEGFVGVPLAQAVRTLLRGRFPKAKYNVTVGRRWFWGGNTIAQLRARSLSQGFRPIATNADDPAAIIFTTGSTGPPKGVLYRHGNFDHQVTEIHDFYNIQPGEIDLPGFPLFALFNCAMGVTTVIPDMDPTRPARVDPRNIIEAVNDWKVTQAFGSPALWNVVGRYCEEHQIVLPTLKRVLSAGAPVPPHVLKRMKAAIPPDGDIHTPYGATEALPVASVSASEVLVETAAKSAVGSGTCVFTPGGATDGVWFPDFIYGSGDACADACRPTFKERSNGDVSVFLTLSAKQSYAEAFVRDKTTQVAAGNVANTAVANFDGTFTYSRTVAASSFHTGDSVTFRWYYYINGQPGVFAPGPTGNTWFLGSRAPPSWLGG